MNMRRKLSSYTLICKNRSDGYGGVTILLKDHIQYSPLPDLTLDHNIQVLGIHVSNLFRREVSVLSVYCPNGNNYNTELIANIFNQCSGTSIVCGDFNAHHRLWTTLPDENLCGRAIFDFLCEDPNWMLATPQNLATRRCPRSSIGSTIDLTFTTSDLGLPQYVGTGPFWNSDHIPVFISLTLPRLTVHNSKIWALKDSKWKVWNESINNTLTSDNFKNSNNPNNPPMKF